MRNDRFNLSAWAIAHPAVTLFCLLALLAAGTMSYLRLGRAEDPDFVIKTMVIVTQWPGATAREVELQITDRIEKKLQELPYYDQATSTSKPGESIIKVNLRQDTPAKAVPGLWYEVRKKIGDIRGSLPDGVQGPHFNDEFGDTFGVIYAFGGEGFTSHELKRIAEDARQRLLRVPHVGKVELYGSQEDRVHVEFSHAKLATLGITPSRIFDAIRRHNAMAGGGIVESREGRIAVRLAGWPTGVGAIAGIPIEANGRSLRLGDVARVTRGPEDPKTYTMRFQGEPVVGLGIAMARDGNIDEMGRGLARAIDAIRADLPLGVRVEQIADQPQVVGRSFAEFVRSLAEALVIVLAVSFLSLGLRSGVVVALSVPLVLAITFFAMDVLGINFQRISLGALIIALGLLVDDAIIAVEMMMVKLEAGWDRARAAAFAYASTAFPMLTGTIVTAAGFLPVGFARSTAGEYTNSIFWVVGLALMVSWIVAVVFTPFLGHAILAAPRRARAHDGYAGRGYRGLRRIVEACVRRRRTTIAVTAIAFVAAVAGFTRVPQQFFPAANRPELVIDLRLAAGSSFAATERSALRLEKLLMSDPDLVSVTAHVGAGTPRFYLPLNPELKSADFAQFVVVARDDAARERVFRRLRVLFAEDFPEARGRVARLENGPPVGYPVQFRVVGPDPDTIRRIAAGVRDVMRANPHTWDVNLEWNEKRQVVRLEIDWVRASELGLTPLDVSNALDTMLSGLRLSQLREGRDLIDIVARAVPAERLDLGALADLSIVVAGNRSVPLGQVARLRHEIEEAVLWRRDRETMLAVRADIADATQAPVVSAQIDAALAPMRASLPAGYRIDRGGAIEESVKSQRSIAAVVPVMILVMLAVLVVQLQSFARVALVFLTAPLGIIGVTVALLATGFPFGFVAMLGVIALAGMIMRNSVILVDQIDQDIAAGSDPWTAVIDATIRRARPIVLTAAAAVLAMIPLAQSAFWAPMAVAIMGGLTGATVLTLLSLPALYAAWFRLAEPVSAPVAANADAPALALAAD